MSLRFNGRNVIEDDLIAIWDTNNIFDGRKTLRLNVFDNNRNLNSEYVYLTVNNIGINIGGVNLLEAIEEPKPTKKKIKEEEAGIICNESLVGKCDFENNRWCRKIEVPVLIGYEYEYKWEVDNYCNQCPDDEDCLKKGPCGGTKYNCIPITGIINNKNLDRYEIDYTNTVLIDWQNLGIYYPESKLNEVLGYLHYSELPYNGSYVLRLKVYDKEGVLVNEEVSNLFEVKGLYRATPNNNIKNYGSSAVKGFLSLWIEKEVNSETQYTENSVIKGGEWEHYMTLSDENIERNIIREADFKLLSLFVDSLKNKIKIKEPGKYRLMMNFFSSSGESVILPDWFEFEVIDEIFVQENKCGDGTIRLGCSKTKPLFCSPELGLIQNCNACGCNKGKKCQDDGRCV